MLGDYIDGGIDSFKVLNLIYSLQQQYPKQIIALMGNHEEWFLNHKDLIDWIRNLPLYYETDKQIFVHAGVDEEAEEYWLWGTSDDIFLNKYPAETGSFCKDIIAGHIGTAQISGNKDFHDIFWDGESHYYIDGTVYISKEIPVLVYDSDTGKYYSLEDDGTLNSHVTPAHIEYILQGGDALALLHT